MSKLNYALVALAAVSLTPAVAMADDYLSVNSGYYDIFRKNQKAAQFGAEYTFEPIEYGIAPMIGGFVTTKESTYGYAGLNWTVPILPQQLYIMPNFAVGAYGHGDGKDLGGILEFRSGIELDYQFQNAQRLGIALNHISNAGIYSRNPGEETLMATYSIPVSTISHWINGNSQK